MICFCINGMKSYTRNIMQIRFRVCPLETKKNYTFDVARVKGHVERLVEQCSAFSKVIIYNSTLQNEVK